MKPKKIPMRMCVGCREMKEKRELIRLVRTAEGKAVFDPSGRLPGRGAYVCRSADCLRRAMRQRQLERQLQVPLSPEAGEELAAELERLSGEGGT